jgi:hypothetical protein
VNLILPPEILQAKLKEKGLPWEKAKAFDDLQVENFR